MPLYEFECENCGFQFEEMIKLKDTGEEIECPKCQNRAKKLISGLRTKHFSWASWRVTEETNRK